MGKIRTRLGDGSFIEITEQELMEDLESGSQDAADRAKVPTLTSDDIKFMKELFMRQDRFVGCEIGKEVVMTYDEGTLKIRRHGGTEDRLQSLILYEKFFGADTAELAHVDYSYKPIKPVMSYEQAIMEQAVLLTHIPIFYGAMPNMGTYTEPDGPWPNPMMLLPAGKVKEAREAYEHMIEDSTKDIVFTGSGLWEAGADGINLDTVGASGDADALASFKAVEIMRAKYPDMPIEVGMAGEFILGLHGDLSYKGTKLAGLYPHQQVKLAEQAGVSIFGPVVNTNTSETIAWNVARACTFVKACVEAANIPVHVNMGMGVGGVVMSDFPPVDALSRASVCMVEIAKVDGL